MGLGFIRGSMGMISGLSKSIGPPSWASTSWEVTYQDLDSWAAVLDSWYPKATL